MSGNGGRHTVLLWDIDGTLLTTARAGILALEAAIAEVLGGEADLSDLFTAGLTDAEVVNAAVAHLGRECGEDAAAEILRAYERELPRVLPLREGRVMPGVREALEDLDAREDVTNALLTGNTRAGARAKLSHYGLHGYFDGGGFCTGPGKRAEIAAEARDRIAETHGPGARLFVIGDTPHDVECGRAIGAATIAVATGPHPREDLERSEPWLLLERIPEPAAFRELLGLG